MNLFELFVKIGVDDQASGNISKITQSLGNGLKTAAKVGASAVGAASTAVVALGKIGLEYNSQMEQYTTNFTTMLGSQEAAVQKVEELKKFAASTPLSMDDLAKGTQTLLAFGVESENSTGILRQLGDIALGDADKMQRLATAFGKATASGKVTGDTVQQMIDAGWNPLIQISNAAGETMEETQKRMSAGAISVEELKAAMNAVTSGTGQFAGGMESASHTTQGLISTLKDNANALVGEVFMPISDGLLGSVLPGAIESISRLTTAFRENGISGMIEAAGSIVGSAIGEFTNALPNFVNIAIEIITSLVQGISDNLPTIASSAIEMITVLANGILEMLPEIIKLGLELIVSLANGISESLPELIPTIVDVVLQIVETLTNPDQLKALLNAALTLVKELAKGIVDAIPNLVKSAVQLVKNFVNFILDKDNIKSIIDTAFEIIMTVSEGLISSIPQLVSAAIELITGLCSFFLDPQNISTIMDMALEIVVAIAEGLVNAATELISGVATLIGDIVDTFADTDWGQIGKNIVDGLLNGLKNTWTTLTSWFTNAWDSLVGGVKDFLGIHSPSRVFAGIGKNMALGLGEGWEYEYGDIKRGIQNDFNFKTGTVDFASSGFGVSSAGIINSNATNNYSGSNFPSSIELRLSSSDGQTFGRWLVPFIRSENRSNPEVVSDI